MADVVVKAINIHQPTGLRRAGLATDFGTIATPPFNIFQITGGAVMVSQLYGHATVAANAGLQTPRLRYWPDANPAWVWLSAAVGAAATPINTLFTWAGLNASLLTRSALGWMDANTVTEAWVGGKIVLGPGLISVFNGVALDTALMVDWYIYYEGLSIDTRVMVV